MRVKRIVKNSENNGLTGAKVLFSAKDLRSQFLPFNQRSSTGFCSGAWGANNIQVTRHSVAANPQCH
jgi:hypothetical protein